MIVAPCSMRALSAIANAYDDDLVVRAADVCMKEGRRVVLMPREMPLNRAHCRNLLRCAEDGYAILPPMLTFYNELLLDVATRSLRDWLEDHPDKALDVNWDWIDSTVNGEPRVRDLASFVRNRKRPDKPVPAFDRNDLGSPENLLFGHDGVPLHFDDSFVDVFGRRQAERIAMYDPLTYLLDEEAGVDVAPHWRISSGIMQPDTALSTEVNLAEAARRCLGVQDVAFQTVWDRAHVMAERSGAPEQNVIEWIGCCLG